MDDSSTGETFTRDEVEFIAQSWAPPVRQLIQRLGQLAAQDPANRRRYNWSDKKVDDVQIFYYSGYFHNLLCYHLRDGSKSQKEEFVPMTQARRAVNPLPQEEVSEYIDRNFPGKSSAAKQGKKPLPKRGSNQPTSSNSKSSTRGASQNPYPNLGKSSPDSLPPSQSIHPITMVLNNGYPRPPNATAADRFLYPSDYDTRPSGTNHNDDLYGSLGAPDPANYSTATGHIPEQGGGQQRAWTTPQYMGQGSTINLPHRRHQNPGEAELDQSSSHPTSHAPASAPALNLFQPIHVPLTPLSHESACAPTPSSRPENSSSTSLRVPIPTRGSTGTITTGDSYHQRQSASSSSHFGFQNLLTAPSPSSALLPNSLTATSENVGTPLSSSGGPTTQDIYPFFGMQLGSKMLVGDDAVKPESQLWRYPDISDSRMPQIPGPDHLASAVPIVGNARQINAWQVHDSTSIVSILILSSRNNNGPDLMKFIPGHGALSGYAPNPYAIPPDHYMNEGHTRLAAGRGAVDPELSQKRKRSRGRTENNDSLLREARAAQPPPRSRSQKKRKQNA
jgi:hypothetical protein